MGLGFGGDVATYYARFRRGYPAGVLEDLRETFQLTPDDTVLDLGCGTGQLAVPLASRVRHVVGMDPEPDMLRLAAETSARHGVTNASWVLGSDTDVPALGALLHGRPLAMTVIGQALHWMRHEVLFAELSGLLRPGGGVAVLANGTPAWLHDTDWSRALRGCLEEYFGTELKASCGTAGEDRERYARALAAAGFGEVRHREVSYAEELTFEELFGGVCSAVPEDMLPAPAERPAFAERIRQALPHGTFTEQVRVSVLTGRTARARH
ncbi:methyltransferase [Streptomyces abyssalis]|uniref:Methyltransferase n=1 Tax=Streptomyces abyssalis TaxID=933944 RepID=A0A1E7JNZ8_9ACTN|nr:class I SAM-dependent methyltransferase [Streptomyces abyssalis]OEU86640.1 methyltransferase [Streptomyces abyssalis]OEU89973.1 methyltransferase [Streptomyces abyssalis]OEV28708.1 methyltransferase [Streptomyces nanshensis]